MKKLIALDNKIGSYLYDTKAEWNIKTRCLWYGITLGILANVIFRIVA